MGRASAVAAIAAIAMSSAAENKPRKSRKPAEQALAWTDIGIVIDLQKRCGMRAQALVAGGPPAVQRLPILFASVISRAFVARLIKGCRVDAVPITSTIDNRALSTL